MKKLISAAAAVLCAVLLGLCASSRSAYDYDRYYDDEWDCYFLFDPDTGDYVGIQFSDGSVIWEDGYDDSGSQGGYYGRREQYEQDTKYLSAPTASADVSGDYPVLTSRIPCGWVPDGCYIQRSTSSWGSWQTLDDVYVSSDNGETLTYRYTDYSADYDETYYYRFCYYMYFDSERTVVATAQTEANVGGVALAPFVEKQEISDTTANFTIAIDNGWGAVKCIVSRRTSTTGAWVNAGTITSFTPVGTDGWLMNCSFGDMKLTQKTQYFYRFEFYDASGRLVCDLEQNITTAATPKKPYLAETAHADNIVLRAVVDSNSKPNGCEVYRYDTKTKKWTLLEDITSFYHYESDEDIRYISAEYTDSGLKSTTKYKYKLKLYREINGERDYFSVLEKSVSTLMPAPKLTVGVTSKKATLRWNQVKGAAGYEIYRRTIDVSNSRFYFDTWVSTGEQRSTLPVYDAALARYNQGYRSYLYTAELSQFKKIYTVKDSTKTSLSYTLSSGKIYVYMVRAYKMVGGKKVYGEYSAQETTDSTSALLNGLALKSKTTVSAKDLELIKKALKKCTNSKMTKAEKAAAVYVYVHNAAIYEYDYSKIPSDPIEAILVAGRGQCYQYAYTYQAMMQYLGFDVKLVSGKTSSGGPHWWCELRCAGKSYMIDPQVGGRFLITYDSMGEYAVKKEKVYD